MTTELMSKKLTEQRAAIVARAKPLDAAVTADPENAEARAAWAVVEKELRNNQDAIERSQRLEFAENNAVEPGDDSRDSSAGKKETDPVEHPPEDYSLLRAVRCKLAGTPVDGVEGEISQEIAKRQGKEATGFYMPFNLRMGGNVRREKRDFDVSAGSGGIATVTSPRYIDLLRNRMLLYKLGATVLTGMKGNFEVPKMTGAGQAYWVTEGNAPTESAQSIGQVAFVPNTCGAFTDITRKLTKQVNRDSEMLVRDDLNKVQRIEFDRVGLNGSGTGAEPEGALVNASVGTVAIGTNGGAFSWAKVVEMETAVATDNADVDGMHYVMTPQAYGACKTIERAANTGKFLMNDNGQMNGYQAHRTNQLPSNLTKGSGTALSAALFGDFSSIMYAFWGGVDVTVDPFTFSSSGTVRIVLLTDLDVQLRHAEALQKIVDIDT